MSFDYVHPNVSRHLFLGDYMSSIDDTKKGVRRTKFIAWMKANYGTKELWRNPANLPPSDYIWQGWNAALDDMEANKRSANSKSMPCSGCGTIIYPMVPPVYCYECERKNNID